MRKQIKKTYNNLDNENKLEKKERASHQKRFT